MRHTDIAFQAASAAAIICVGLCAVKVQACWTECEGCQTYDEELGYCVDDHSKCGSHYCENSICVECLVDDHCDMCKYCRPASRTCQDIYVESLHVLFSDVLCVGGATEFAASTFPWGKECQLSWDHEGASEVQGECGWTWARWTQPGVYTVTAGCGENSQSVQITVVGVQSIEVNKEAVCWNDPNGILFEAIPDPNGPMTCLQWEGRRKSDINDPWGQWGMVGWECYNPPAGGFWCPTIRLATPIPGYYQFRARNGQDGSWSESPVVVVVRAEIDIISSPECDGVQVDVDLTITPESGKNYLTGIDFVAVEPDGVTNYGNPSGEGLTFSQRGDITQWKIDNTRWYSTQQDDHCNQDSGWRITATYCVGNSNCTTNTEHFTASAAFGTCLDGAASLTNIWSGNIQIMTVQLPGGQWQATITQGTWHRDVRASAWWHIEGGIASQFYDMIKDEELFHVGQFEGTTSTILNNLWDDQTVMANATANQPFVASTQAGAYALANNAFIVARYNEEYRSSVHLAYPHATRCAAESEAKSAAGASYIVDMPCTYPSCP